MILCSCRHWYQVKCTRASQAGLLLPSWLSWLSTITTWHVPQSPVFQWRLVLLSTPLLHLCIMNVGIYVICEVIPRHLTAVHVVCACLSSFAYLLCYWWAWLGKFKSPNKYLCCFINGRHWISIHELMLVHHFHLLNFPQSSCHISHLLLSTCFINGRHLISKQKLMLVHLFHQLSIQQFICHVSHTRLRWADISANSITLLWHSEPTYWLKWFSYSRILHR